MNRAIQFPVDDSLYSLSVTLSAAINGNCTATSLPGLLISACTQHKEYACGRHISQKGALNLTDHDNCSVRFSIAEESPRGGRRNKIIHG